MGKIEREIRDEILVRKRVLLASPAIAGKGELFGLEAKNGWRAVLNSQRSIGWQRQGESNPCYQDENLVS